MRCANEAIKRVRHPIPTVDDVSFELNGAQCFSKLDLSQAYHQLELEEESRYITTFSTHLELYRYKRLNYGTNAAAEIFQYTLQAQLQGLKGVKNIADDIIVYGTTREEHDENLDRCLKRLFDRGLRLNQSKCKFLNETLEFFGQIFSKDGCKPDPKRYTALKNAPKPTNLPEVRSLLGMATYSSKYIPNFATITAPLRILAKKNAKFEWTSTHQDAYDQLTSALSSAPCMAYFSKHKDTFITVDASPVGLSAILSQKTKGRDDDEKVIAYASRSLTDTEMRYSQTEKEALAIVWGVEHFHIYVYGHEFVLVTDHKLLETIYGNRNYKTSARIERWVLRLQPYSFMIQYKPGSENPADYLSRHPTSTSFRQQRMTEPYINMIVSASVPKALTLEEIEADTNDDHTLRAVRAAIKSNKRHYDKVKRYKAFKDELTVTSKGIILCGTRIVMPHVLQQRAIDLAHISHLGITKTKALIREKIWFPGVDEMIKNTIAKCIPCQAVGTNTKEPIGSTEMPERPWDTLHMDFYGPLPSGEYLLVVIDRYSRFPEVEDLRSTKASSVIPKLDKIFAVHGIPRIIKTDNGPPFNGEEYRRYGEALGINLKFSTPLWPQGNAEAERFMQLLAKALKTAKIAHRPWQQELQRFLLQYRTTPHCSTGVPPAELLFNRTVQGQLPILVKRTVVNRHKEARQNEKKRQEYNAKYANNKSGVKKSDLKVGDNVLVRQERKNKLTSHFNPTPYVVTKREQSRVTARNARGHVITRNVSHFKSIPKPKQTDSDESDYEDREHIPDNENTENRNEQISDQEAEQQPLRRSTRVRSRPYRFGQSAND